MRRYTSTFSMVTSIVFFIASPFIIYTLLMVNAPMIIVVLTMMAGFIAVIHMSDQYGKRRANRQR